MLGLFRRPPWGSPVGRCWGCTLAARRCQCPIATNPPASRRSAPILPLLLRPAQDLLVRAGVDLTPNWVRTILGLNGHGLHPWEAEVIRQAGAFADHLVVASNPAVQACGRMRLPADYLYVHRSASREHRSVSVGDVQEPDLI
jgi:hypothetical protein